MALNSGNILHKIKEVYNVIGSGAGAKSHNMYWYNPFEITYVTMNKTMNCMAFFVSKFFISKHKFIG